MKLMNLVEALKQGLIDWPTFIKLAQALVIVLWLTGCGHSKQADQSVSCTNTDTDMIHWPDGTSLKSGVYSCTNGCTKYVSIDTPSLSLTLCGE